MRNLLPSIRARFITCLIIVILVILGAMTNLDRSGTSRPANRLTSPFVAVEKNTYDAHELKNLSNYPWPEDPDCSRFEVKFAEPNSLPVFPLVSFPGSGVTWFRQMIEGVTGIYTSAVYPSDKPIIVKGHYGNKVNASCMCTILEKTHEATVGSSFKKYFDILYRDELINLNKEKGVLLLRNPVDAAIAYRNYMFAGKVRTAGSEHFKGPAWEEFVRYAAFAWVDLAVRWIDRIQTGTVVFYENLVHHTEAELKRIIPHFDANPIDPLRLACAVKHKSRTDWKRMNRTKIELTPAQKLMFKTVIETVQLQLRRRNWPPLPIDLYKF